MILAASPIWTATPAIGAAIGYGLLAFAPRPPAQKMPAGLMAVVWVLHLLALILPLLQSPVHFGFATALSFTAWLVFSLYTVESRLYPRIGIHWTLAGFGAAAALLAVIFPGPAQPHILSSWLPVHWALGISSYGLLAAAVLHGWLMQRAEASMRHARPTETTLPLLALERLTFQFVLAAFVLLTLTLAAGWWFTELLNPHGWAWTHKTVFTLLSWAVLGVLLLGRWQWGWRGRLAVRMLYASAALLLLGYVGSRFVIEVILLRA